MDKDLRDLSTCPTRDLLVSDHLVWRIETFVLPDGLPKSKHGGMSSLHLFKEPDADVGARNPHDLDRKPMTGQ